MTSPESQVDKDILERMLDWVSDIEEFERHHAVDGLFHAMGFSTPPFTGDKESFFLLALNTAFWFWIDDRSDKHLSDRAGPVNWAGMIELIEGKREFRASKLPAAPEERYYFRLSKLIQERAGTETEYDFWRQTVSKAARGMCFEEDVNANGRTPTYIECIEHGVGFSTIPNLISTAALVYGVSRAERQSDMIVVDLERCFSIHQRMLNDLNGVEKERREGTYGKKTNLVLLMENKLGAEAASKFIENEMSSMEQMVFSMMERLGVQDPFVKLIRHAMNNINAWYASKPKRCSI